MTFSYWEKIYDPAMNVASTPQERYANKMISIQSLLASSVFPLKMLELFQPLFDEVSAESGWGTEGEFGENGGASQISSQACLLSPSSHHRRPRHFLMSSPPMLGRPPVPHLLIQPMTQRPRFLSAVKASSSHRGRCGRRL